MKILGILIRTHRKGLVFNPKDMCFAIRKSCILLIGLKISQIDQAVRPPLAEADRPLDLCLNFNKLYENNGKH